MCVRACVRACVCLCVYVCVCVRVCVCVCVCVCVVVVVVVVVVVIVVVVVTAAAAARSTLDRLKFGVQKLFQRVLVKSEVLALLSIQGAYVVSRLAVQWLKARDCRQPQTRRPYSAYLHTAEVLSGRPT